MGKDEDKPPDIGPPAIAQHKPNQLIMTPAQAGGGNAGPRKKRTFAEIIADELQNRNILEIESPRIDKWRNGSTNAPHC